MGTDYGDGYTDTRTSGHCLKSETEAGVEEGVQRVEGPQEAGGGRPHAERK